MLERLGEPLAAPVGHVALLQVELFESAVHLWRKEMRSLVSVLVVAGGCVGLAVAEVGGEWRGWEICRLGEGRRVACLEHLRSVVNVLLLVRPEQRSVECERAHSCVVAHDGSERDQRRDAELALAQIQLLQRRVQLQHLRHVHGAAISHLVAVQLQTLQRRVVLRSAHKHRAA